MKTQLSLYTCHSTILKNYNSREDQKVLGKRVSTTRFRSEPASDYYE